MSKTKVRTPLMEQYYNFKKKYPGALLLFRVGDFYETFEDDAEKASQLLNITLTKRGAGSVSEVYLAGFPYHALDTYLPKLVRAGCRVAVCDQLETSRPAKGIVKRGVTELITPGVSLHEHTLDVKQNNFLGSLYVEKHMWGMALFDISTGQFYVAQGKENYIHKLIQNLKPAEIIFGKSQRSSMEQQYGKDYATYALDDWVFSYDYGYEKLTQQFKTKNLKGFGVEEFREAVVAAGSILHYLEITEHKNITHVRSISRIDEEKFVWIDDFTMRSLEIIEAQQGGGIPLVQVLDRTVTAMGSRQMKSWLSLPLKSKAAIDERLYVVDAFYQDEQVSAIIGEQLIHVSDLERLSAKVAVNRANPREMLRLKKSLMAITPIKKSLEDHASQHLKNLGEGMHSCQFLISKIDQQLYEDSPMAGQQGNIIQQNVDPRLDELRGIISSSKDKLVEIRNKEAINTGITSLSISYNKAFGYYLKVSNTHKNKVPPTWIRKQTLTSGERYITEELKQYEEEILGAEEECDVLERKIFQELVQYTAEFIPKIQQSARFIANLDCLLAFAIQAKEHHYVKPNVNDGYNLIIRDGRHPVIETQLSHDESYVPNDVKLDDTDQQILIITGPNMSGKSALLRQTALIVLMAQVGSFVPATSAEVGIVDRIYTRVGASDNLSRGESTFMLEMTETASILNNLSHRSLLLMDEIGRGTSTYDGVSIAWAVIEYIHGHKENRPKTLFATHYHELNQLQERLERVKNFNVAVKEAGDQIIFMRKLKKGGASNSYGIHVAQLAGMPTALVKRARDILNNLEKKSGQKTLNFVDQSQILQQNDKHPTHAIAKEIEAVIENLDVDTISPVEALMKLHEIITLWRKK